MGGEIWRPVLPNQRKQHSQKVQKQNILAKVKDAWWETKQKKPENKGRHEKRMGGPTLG